MGFLLWWVLLWPGTGPRVPEQCVWASVVLTRSLVSAARGLNHCGTQAQLLLGMWNLPGPGIEPMSPALAGGSLSLAQPGKSSWVPFEDTGDLKPVVSLARFVSDVPS